MPVSRRVPWGSLRARFLRTATLLAVVVFALWITGCMETQFYHPDAGPTPAPAGFVGAEEVTFRSADGTRLCGWFIPSQTPETGSAAATILHVHGNAGNMASHLFFSEGLPRRGFNLFLFDYRGYGQSEGSPRRRDDLIADTDAALDTLLARTDVDPARLGLFGHSLGGGIGLNVMAERPEIRAAVIESSFSSWRDVAADAVAFGERAGPIARTLAAILIRDHRRPDEAIARIDRPILIIHGDADDIVPIHHAEALAEAGPNVESLLIPYGDHNTLRDIAPDLDGRIAAFFREHLAP